MQEQHHVINNVTGLNPVPVSAVIAPKTVEEVREAIVSTAGPISIGGGRFSMGGQTASPGSMHPDMRQLNQVIDFSSLHRTVRVQAGICGRDLQRFLDPHDLAVTIMQTYANFTVGGSLSVNVHGRYVGLGPLILSVRSISVVLADGALIEASPTEHPELFHGVIGGYGGLGVIVEAELELAENTRVERMQAKLSAKEYLEHFRKTVRDSGQAVFHNADLYPPHYTKVRSVTWIETQKPVTTPHRLMPVKRSYPLYRYFLWAVSESPLGKWRHEHIIDPVLYLRSKVHWRNYEASYDVGELEPASRSQTTYVLQEYFVPIEQFEEFVAKMADILQRHQANILNISVRHAVADPGALLAWARQEVFAFVIYYKQHVGDNARNHVGVWTRELIDAALSVDGSYYLPYQAHATVEQFHRAYPRAGELFALKRKLDPRFRLRNVIWDTYYAPTLQDEAPNQAADCEFHAVFSDVASSDGFYRFLQTIYRLYPEDRFHMLIKESCARHATDEAIYRHIQERLGEIKPFLSELFYALPALKKQKREMTRQTLEILGDKRAVQGYVEIGSMGRYVSELRRHIRIDGPVVVVDEMAPTYAPIDIVERGQLTKLGRFVPLNDYAPLSSRDIADRLNNKT